MNITIKAILAAIVIVSSNTGVFASTERPIITLVQGKITEQDFIDPEHTAIVNQANERLDRSWGVCKEIYDAASWPEEQKPSTIFEANADGVRCPAGKALITTGGNLSPLHIIHAVGPDCSKEAQREQKMALFISTYENSLTTANDHNITTLAIPCSLSIGRDKAGATHIAITMVINFLQEHAKITEVRFVAQSKADYEFYKYHLELSAAAEPVKLIQETSGGTGDTLIFRVPPKQALMPQDDSWGCIVQ